MMTHVIVPRPDCWPADPVLLDSFDTPALLVDAAGQIVFANEAARRSSRSDRALVGTDLVTRVFEDESEQEALSAVVHRVLAGKPWKGRLEVARDNGSRHSADVSCSPLWREGAVVGLLCVLHDPRIPGESERAARRLGENLTRLARVTAELAMADTVETVTKIVTTHTADAVGATLASLTLRESENLLRLVGLAGGREGEAQQWETFPILTRTPASDVIRSGKRLVLTGAAAIAERYPDLPASNRGQRSLVCLPLRVTTRTIGAIGLSFPGLRTMDSTELEFLEIMADTCAQALDRISNMNEAPPRRPPSSSSSPTRRRSWPAAWTMRQPSPGWRGWRCPGLPTGVPSMLSRAAGSTVWPWSTWTRRRSSRPSPAGPLPPGPECTRRPVGCGPYRPKRAHRRDHRRDARCQRC